MALPNAPNVPDLGIDFADEFAHLGQMTEFAGRVGEALGLVINSAQSLAVEPSAARGRVAECRNTSVAPGWPVSRSERSSLPGRVKVWLTQLPASLDCRQVYVHRIGARPSEA